MRICCRSPLIYAEAGARSATVCASYADIDLDPFDEETIKLANPAIDVFMNCKEVLAMAADDLMSFRDDITFQDAVVGLDDRAGFPLPFPVSLAHGALNAYDLA